LLGLSIVAEVESCNMVMVNICGVVFEISNSILFFL